jgi:pyruvate formate-lyase activating enzyme-like uncharacterized protein
VEVVNNGKKEIHIKSVNVHFCGKKIKSMGMEADSLSEFNKDSKNKYPCLLKHGEYLKTDFGIDGILSTIGEQLNKNDKLCIQVQGTLKKYYI